LTLFSIRSSQNASDFIIKKFYNFLGIFITCNKIPDYGEEQENIERRLAIFQTSSLPDKKSEAPQWMEDHWFECVLWMVNEINRNCNLLPKEELFYELPCNVKPKFQNSNQQSKELTDAIKTCKMDVITYERTSTRLDVNAKEIDALLNEGI